MQFGYAHNSAGTGDQTEFFRISLGVILAHHGIKAEPYILAMPNRVDVVFSPAIPPELSQKAHPARQAVEDLFAQNGVPSVKISFAKPEDPISSAGPEVGAVPTDPA
jgi:hypothetical protein